MSRWIDGKWLLNFFVGFPDDYTLTIGNLRAVINDAPSVVPSRAEGEWVDKGYYADCSKCGAKSGTQYDGVEPAPLKSQFCPNCGAKMKGAEYE